MDPLAFAREFDCSALQPLRSWRKDDIPRTPGVYIFVAKQSFIYPNGESPVFYIGMASRLRRRLRQHQRGIERAEKDRKHPIYHPAWEYAARFGVDVSIVEVDEPRQTEFRLLSQFARDYRSLPVANNAVNRRMIPKLFPVQPSDIDPES